MNSRTKLIACALVLVAGAFLLALLASPAMAGPRDAAILVTRALPAQAETVTSTAIDTGKSTAGVQSIPADFVLVAPALTTQLLADAATMTYTVKWSANADLSAPTTYITGAIVQTGAGGAGAATATYRFRLPSTAARYVFFTVTASGATDVSSKSATLDIDF